MLKWVHIFDFHVNKGLGFKVNDHVEISKYKHIFAKGYILNWSDKIFVIKTVKNIVLWTYVATFYEIEFKKKIKQSLKLRKK